MLSKNVKQMNVGKVIFCFGLLLLLLTACLPLDITVKAAVETGYLPFATVDEDGKESGFSVDLMNAIAEVANFNVEYEGGPSFENILAGVQDGTYDVAVTCVFVTQEREKMVSFTTPFYTSGMVLMTQAENDAIQSINDLTAESIIGVLAGTVFEDHAREHLPGQIVTYTEAVEGQSADLAALANGDVDAVVFGINAAQENVQSNPSSFKIAGDPLTENICAFAVNKGRPTLLEALNDGIAQLKENGQLDALLATYFDADDQ
ncbi:ABC transporter substrate-binding protein [Chloroflexi bacterium TSY]|nr:ABC transporter substrate-binding protein [Chloroflexi bacterium TSY]